MDRRTFLTGAAASVSTVTAAAAAATAHTSPEDRIKAAMDEIEVAMTEMFPDFIVQRRYEVIPAVDGKGNALRTDRICAMVYASPQSFGPEEARYYVNYL